jgi:hypothetical protein
VVSFANYQAEIHEKSLVQAIGGADAGELDLIAEGAFGGDNIVG